ncbi:monofunctional biosynthetic peptidoglycan transglycosylase [Vibrio maritimus]|uniref:Monofunctional biosynthetic peptidoglycan transglycosylase n=1 Tax=Vibrio maritimus TaxID=990268 RepID=A0A090T9X3_9VIBR|nr:monofunctional biosynthetic peptidoglycan transglycosylase [Vibrio maritimus]
MIKKLFINITCILLGVPLLLVIFFKFINPPIWGWKIARTLSPPEGYPTQTHHQWAPLTEISSNMPKAVIASEDQRFPEHYGIDIDALWSVISQSDTTGPARGASTITQQTAKKRIFVPQPNLYPKSL